MKKKILMIGFLIVIFSSLTLLTPARSETNKDIQEIKERLIRLEAKVEEGQKILEDGLKYTNKRMDDICSFFFVLSLPQKLFSIQRFCGMFLPLKRLVPLKGGERIWRLWEFPLRFWE